MNSERRILLIIGGGIAAYKCLELIRRLQDREIHVRCLLTEAGSQFVTPLSLSSLSGEPVYGELFSLTDEAEMGHIRLSREADLIVVAPATADLMAKMAAGIANDLATTVLLATDKPVIVAPSMNVLMWDHPATKRNVRTLEADGIMRVGPGEGDLACGEEGEGRLAEVEDILAAVDKFFQARDESEKIHPLPGPGDRPLAGKRALVTAGPTFEAIDPVRYIANRSSGKQGYAVAAALADLGADTTLISGPTHLPAPAGVTTVRVESAQEMLAACERALPADIAVCAAAVGDWRAKGETAQKIKKDGKGGKEGPRLELEENPDILHSLAARESGRPGLVIGFAAETENVLEHARGKRLSKQCDWILANDVSPGSGVMGGDFNTVHFISEDAEEAWPKLSKSDVAKRLAVQISRYFNGRKRGVA